MKKILTLISILLIATGIFAVSIRQTSLPVQNNGAGLYGKQTNGLGIQLIGTNSSNQVVLDADKAGLVNAGFLGNSKQTTIDTSSSVNATITPVGTYTIVDTLGDVAVATVNSVITSNIAIGTEIWIQSNLASQDIVFIETGNLDLGGTRTLSDPVDIIKLIKSGANQWVESSYVDNN